MSYIVDARVFAAKGGVVDWVDVSRRQQKAEASEAIAARRALLSTTSIQLRWGFDPALGYPIEPVIVWAKPPGVADREIPFGDTPFGILLSEP